MIFYLWMCAGFLTGVIFASFFEWALHRYIMHTPLFNNPFFKKHAIIHHGIFKADHTYHLQDEKDKETIPMGWWHGPAIVFTCLIPFIIFSVFSHKWSFSCGAFIAFSGYFTAYEYMHWCMHLPKKRHINRSGIFFYLNGHHLIHHVHMHKNFNVVLPLADIVLGTFIRRAKKDFNQAEGETVPNVQPKKVSAELMGV